jgi:hypothetical protein
MHPLKVSKKIEPRVKTLESNHKKVVEQKKQKKIKDCRQQVRNSGIACPSHRRVSPINAEEKTDIHCTGNDWDHKLDNFSTCRSKRLCDQPWLLNFTCQQTKRGTIIP